MARIWQIIWHSPNPLFMVRVDMTGAFYTKWKDPEMTLTHPQIFLTPGSGNHYPAVYREPNPTPEGPARGIGVSTFPCVYFQGDHDEYMLFRLQYSEYIKGVSYIS